jgi:hypothetical protein
MKVKTMRLVDRWLGAPLCLALTAWRRLTDRSKPAGRPTRIAFFKLAEQGSTVLAAPAIMRAIPLAAGRPLFKLQYLPRTFVIGKWISLASVALWAGLVILCVWRTRRSGSWSVAQRA